MNNLRVRVYRVQRINSQFANRTRRKKKEKEKERSWSRVANDNWVETIRTSWNLISRLLWTRWMESPPLLSSSPLIFLWDESRTRLLLSIQWNQINARWRTIYHACNTLVGRKTRESERERERARRRNFGKFIIHPMIESTRYLLRYFRKLFLKILENFPLFFSFLEDIINWT